MKKIKWHKQPSNWIEGLSMELKQKRKDKWKDICMRIFVYLIFIPIGCAASWYLIWKLANWLLRGF
jgi:hypothetical protein